MARVDEADGQQLDVVLLRRHHHALDIHPSTAGHLRQGLPDGDVVIDPSGCGHVDDGAAPKRARIPGGMAMVVPRPIDPTAPPRIPAETREVGGTAVVVLEAETAVEWTDPAEVEMVRVWVVERIVAVAVTDIGDIGHVSDIGHIVHVGDVLLRAPVGDLEAPRHIALLHFAVLVGDFDLLGNLAFAEFLQLALLDAVGETFARRTRRRRGGQGLCRSRRFLRHGPLPGSGTRDPRSDLGWPNDSPGFSVFVDKGGFPPNAVGGDGFPVSAVAFDSWLRGFLPSRISLRKSDSFARSLSGLAEAGALGATTPRDWGGANLSAVVGTVGLRSVEGDDGLDAGLARSGILFTQVVEPGPVLGEPRGSGRDGGRGWGRRQIRPNVGGLCRIGTGRGSTAPCSAASWKRRSGRRECGCGSPRRGSASGSPVDKTLLGAALRVGVDKADGGGGLELVLDGARKVLAGGAGGTRADNVDLDSGGTAMVELAELRGGSRSVRGSLATLGERRAGALGLIARGATRGVSTLREDRSAALNDRELPNEELDRELEDRSEKLCRTGPDRSRNEPSDRLDRDESRSRSAASPVELGKSGRAQTKVSTKTVIVRRRLHPPASWLRMARPFPRDALP